MIDTVSGSIVVLVAAIVLVAVRARRASRRLPKPYDPTPGERFDHLWGYADTRFEFLDQRTVRLSGSRYPLAGAPLPHFVPFVEDMLGVPIGPDHARELSPPQIAPATVRNEGFVNAAQELVGTAHVSEDDRDRLVHSHGQLSVDEVYRVMTGHVPERVVDLVVYPQSEKQVVALTRLAVEHDVALIPYGGGTNVSGALQCPAGETRPIVSVDMRRMNRVLEIDRDNNRAEIEAGITGGELEARLGEAGLTCGHLPDSVEFSTLGGWIATYASGMKKNRYGNIEDIVLDVTLVTPSGSIHTVPVNPRSSVGIHPRHLALGSEGCLGIITRAVLRLRALPETCRYASFVFPDFHSGLQFLRAVRGSEVTPASIRLAGNQEFRLGQSLSHAEGRGKQLLGRLKKFYLFRLKGFELQRMVAGTLVMEGSRDEVQRQWRTLSRLLAAHGGLSGGAEAGQRGYQVTFAIAYIRDFMSTFDVLGETFETSLPWDRVEPVVAAVEAELHRLCTEYGVPGRPYLSYRVSQSYDTGACVYFTLGFSGRGLKGADRIYQDIEKRLRQVVLDKGGSLSHHHGIGKVRQSFVPRVHTDTTISALRALKREVDPNNIFAAGNNVFGKDA
jgi:alkyldihydroxyacetonephosphate synthase